jgi:hypothetical protein
LYAAERMREVLDLAKTQEGALGGPFSQAAQPFAVNPKSRLIYQIVVVHQTTEF